MSEVGNEVRPDIPQDREHEISVETPRPLTPGQVASAFEWAHMGPSNTETRDLASWQQLEGFFRNDQLIRQMGQWEERPLSETEFWSLVAHQGDPTAKLYEHQSSRLLRNVASEAGKVTDLDDAPYLREHLASVPPRDPLAAPFEDPIIVRQTMGESETREGGSWYIHHGNGELLGYAAHLLETHEPYVPVHAIVGKHGEVAEDAYEIKQKGPIHVKGYKDRDDVPQEQIVNTFRNAEQLYFTFPPKIGDIVMGTAFLHSMYELEKAMGLPPKEKIVVAPPAMHALLAPTCEALNITLINGGGDLHASQNRAEHKARDIDEKKAVVFELDSTGGGDPEGLYFGEGQLTIKNILPSLIDRYGVTEAGPNRQRLYVADLFGVDFNTLDPRNCQPGLALADQEGGLVAGLVEKYGLDTNRTQVTINIETSEPGRQYSLENWSKAAQMIKSAYPDTEFNILFDPKKRTDDETFIDRELVLHTFQDALRSGGNPSTVRMVAEPLQDVLQFMRTQDVLLSNDTGIPHLVATSSVAEMPEVVDLFAAPDADPDKWLSSPQMKPLVPPEDAANDRRGGIYCTEPELKWINKIAAEDVAGQALAIINKKKPRSRTPIKATTLEDFLRNSSTG